MTKSSRSSGVRGLTSSYCSRMSRAIATSRKYFKPRSFQPLGRRPSSSGRSSSASLAPLHGARAQMVAARSARSRSRTTSSSVMSVIILEILSPLAEAAVATAADERMQQILELAAELVLVVGNELHQARAVAHVVPGPVGR